MKPTDEVSLVKAHFVNIGVTVLLSLSGLLIVIEEGNWNLSLILFLSFSLREQCIPRLCEG